MIIDYIREMRVHHYIKNLLIFVALACSGQIFDINKFVRGGYGFAGFCLLSSAVYVINDIRDAQRDRRHPIKCKRPIAAGNISVKRACVFSMLLFVFAVMFQLKASMEVIPVALFCTYFLMNLGYSFGLKNIPILDIVIIVLGFVIRVIYGATITGIKISNWLYLTVMAIAFYLALGKRRNECLLKHTRKVLQFYTEEFLDKFMYMFLTLAIIFYSLWSMQEETVSLYHGRVVVWTVPLIIIISMKYGLDIEGGNSDGDPVEVLFKDKALMAMCVVYLGIMFLMLYI